jgi:hypothetical protein
MGRTFKILKWLGICALMIGLGSELKAQPSASGRFQPIIPFESAQAALSDLYGQAIVKEFGSILHDSADEACLKAKGIGREQLDRTAADLLTRYGQKALDTILDPVDPEIFEKEFTRLGGEQARAEMEGLASDPSMKVYLEKVRPAERDTMVDFIAESFDRYMVIERYRMKRTLSPLDTGNESLLALKRTRNAESEIDAFIEKNQTDRKLQRLLELSEYYADAHTKATMESKRLLAWAPHKAFAGIETELGDLCITFKGKGAPG